MTPSSGPTDAQIGEAEALLYRTIEVIDPTTGEAQRRRIESPLYREYLAARAAHEAARARYEATMREAQATETGRRSWPMIAATHQLPVRQAHDRWRASGAERVERALAILEQAARRTSP